LKVALYARVSTNMQDPKMQNKALVDKAKREGWEYEYFEEQESTRKTRPIKYNLYQRLLNKDFEAVCVWRLDRWARSTQEASREIQTLYERNVKFISLTENIDLSTASGMLQFNVISAFAQFERDLISERVREGLKGKINVGKRGKDKRPRKKSGYLLRYTNKPPHVKQADVLRSRSIR